MKTRFNERTLQLLAKVAQLDKDTRANILARVSNLPLHLYPFEDIDKAVDACLSEAKVSGDDEDWERLGGAIASFLYSVGASAQDPRSLLNAAAKRIEEKCSPADTDVIVKFLAELLDAATLLLSAKATALYEDSQHLLVDSKLLVDVRPIFDPRHMDKVAATTLLYRLRMSYRQPHDSDVQTMVFTLQEAELTELAAVLERAIKKASIVRDYRPFGVTVVESKHDDNDI